MISFTKAIPPKNLWLLLVACLCLLVPARTLAEEMPPMPLPGTARVPSVESVRDELQRELPKKYKLRHITIYADPVGRSVDVALIGDLTPSSERGVSHATGPERARAVAKAFLRENPALFGSAGGDVTIEEERLMTNRVFERTDLDLRMRIAGVPVYLAEARLSLDLQGNLVSVSIRQYPFSAGMIEEIVALAAKAGVTREEALEIAEKDRQRETPDAKIDTVNATPFAEKYVFPSSPYLRWLVGVVYENESVSWGYLIDAVTGQILDRDRPHGVGPGPVTPVIPPPLPPGFDPTQRKIPDDLSGGH